MRRAFALVILFLMTSSLAGCFGDEEVEIIVEISPFSFDREIPSTTWYHYSGGINALNESAMSEANITANFTENNYPIWTNGSYYGIGMSTFEPTIGITSADNIYMSSWGNGVGGATAVVKCTGLIEMGNISDYSCADVYDPLIPVVSSNDPYIYVDKWTDRIMKFDMHALAAMTVEWSDDEGASWRPVTITTSPYSVQDHQTISSAPGALLHPSLCLERRWRK